ncbi:MAG: leucine/isoleucine/valine transporter permease subunit [Chloroflexota bacterium]|nr:leucine/isoleucine/valine transporter permease subunit [Chloroflexota bacterium]
MDQRTTLLRRALWLGFISGALVLYLITVGIVLAFAERNTITGIVTLGRLMLIAPVIGLGYLTAGRGTSAAGRLGAGILTGLTSGVIVGVALLFASSVDIRGILVRVSPVLIHFMEFGQGATTGAAINVALAAAAGLAGAAVRVVSPRLRRPIVSAALGVVIMSMLEPFLRPRLTDFGLIAVARFIFDHKGLTIPAAIIVLVVFAVITAGWPTLRKAAGDRIAAADPGTQATIRAMTILVLIVFLLALPQIAGSFLSQVLVFVGLYTLLALGLNIVVGYAGLLDLGYVAFYAVGSYLTALLTSPISALGLGIPFWIALPIVILGAAVTGLFIGAPVLRLRGDYLAIVTLGFGEISRILFLSDAFKPWFGGAQGILGVPPLLGVAHVSVPILGWELSGPTLTYYPLLFFCVLAAFVAYRLKYSRTGRAWNAMREDEDVAQATGVNTTNYKLLAFALGASVGCLGGAVFVTHLASVFPGTFSILVSITVLSIIILGGMGSIPGVVVGSLALIGLPELLREFAEFKLLVYGGVLVVMMIARPEGLVPDMTRRRELHEVEGEPEPELEPSAEGT